MPLSDFSAILDSTGGTRGIAGATLIGLSMESPSLLRVSPGLGCDSMLAAVENLDGFGIASNFAGCFFDMGEAGCVAEDSGCESFAK